MERRDYTKIFDVSRPSQTGPDATSKPVIVGHHPMMSDPMVRPAAARNDADIGFDTTQHHAKVIEVSDEAKAHIAQAQPTPDQLAAEAAAEEKKMAMLPSQPTSTPNPAPATLAAMPSPAAPVQQPAPPPVMPQQDLSHIQHVPVSHMSASQSGRLKTVSIWIFVVIFLAGFGLYLAIDAGFINAGINLPFHIFSRST